MKKLFKIVISIFLIVCILGIIVYGTSNILVMAKSKNYIVNLQEAKELNDVDCILVLGCRVYSDDTLSPMLRDRVDSGLELYNSGVSSRLLMSGDHGTENYDEVNNMKQYCVDNDITADVVFLDHAGFSTYESMYRAKEIFEADKIIIVTQKYHLYRAVYIARELGIDAYGYSADIQEYNTYTNIKNTVRESLARVKDVFTCIAKPNPTYLGDTIPINGSAELSDDKEYV